MKCSVMKRLIFFTGCLAMLLFAGCANRPVSSSNVVAASDTALFRQVQQQTFQYFWEGAEPTSGLARERIHIDSIYPQKDQSVITSGGGGFGVMAILVGIERGFITREQGLKRMETIVSFLERADRFHGAWPHWWHGNTGKVKPFGRRDNGGDLVETSFMLQGLLCVRQYYRDGSDAEKRIAARIDKLWREVEFDWYRNGQEVLYWHWSPEYGWQMNFPVKGYNECLIMYILAASSPTHSIPASVYHQGWAQNGAIRKPWSYGGYDMELFYQGNPPNGGPLFWAHYSYLGLDPRGLKDRYANYETETRNQALINYQWCVNNPKQYEGYAPNNWGLTASYSVRGYHAHAPDSTNDLGVISPTAALASFPYTPAQSMAAMKYWYNERRNQLWGPYGFYDAFSDTYKWYPQHYLAIDQGPVVVMMENYRSGLLWRLFMSCPEIKEGLRKLDFQSPWLSQK